MALRINYNFQSDFTHVNLLKTEQKLNTALERLSTGYRINSAKDDAAGLFIADQLKLVAEALDQASRNAQDGISAAQIAEASLSQIYDKLTMMYTKAEQAASDTNDPNARAALQRDIEKLTDAIEKIATTSEFNGIKLLTGAFKGKVIHFGARAEQTLTLNIDSAKSQDLGGLARILGGFIAGDANNFSTTAPSTVNTGDSLKLNDVELITEYTNRFGAGSQADAYKLAQVINDLVDGVTAKATNEVVGGSAANGTNFVQLSTDTTANVKLTIEIEGSKGSSGTITFFDQDVDTNANLDIDSLINQINNVSDQTGVVASKTADGKLVLKDVNGGNIKITLNAQVTDIADGDSDAPSLTVNWSQLGLGFNDQSVSGTDDGSATGTAASYYHGGKIDITSSSDITIEENADAVSEKFGISGNFTTKTTIAASTDNYNLTKIDVTTQEGAELAMKIIDAAIKKVDSMRSSLGSIQINLQALIDNNNFAATQTREAESRIRNVDFAKEMAEFTRQQTLMQSGMAMLAQANQLPQLVLQLLR